MQWAPEAGLALKPITHVSSLDISCLLVSFLYRYQQHHAFQLSVIRFSPKTTTLSADGGFCTIVYKTT